jgi:hypothetical protein
MDAHDPATPNAERQASGTSSDIPALSRGPLK